MSREIIIEKEIFEYIYYNHNPKPDIHEYGALGKYYRNMNNEYNKFTRMINEKKYCDFYHTIKKLYDEQEILQSVDLKKLQTYGNWTSIKIGQRTKALLKMSIEKANIEILTVQSPILTDTIDDLIKYFALKYYFNMETEDSFINGCNKASEIYLAFKSMIVTSMVHQDAQNFSSQMGDMVSLPIKKNTRELLNTIKSCELFDNYDEVIHFLLLIAGNKEYKSFIDNYENIKTTDLPNSIMGNVFFRLINETGTDKFKIFLHLYTALLFEKELNRF